jgi:signal transduction histidine kinase
LSTAPPLLTAEPLPAEELDRIWARFYQVKDDTERGRSGLGLAVAREVADRIGGRLSAGPRAGGGMSFVLELPHNPRHPIVDGGK